MRKIQHGTNPPVWIVAKKIHALIDSDLFYIDTVRKYPDDHMKKIEIAKQEYHENARPELAKPVENMSDYDVILIGYPIWHGRMPQAIYSFIESYDLAGKTVIPFNTHEGSGQSGTQQVIENALPGCAVLQGLAIQGKTAQENEIRTRELLTNWLAGLKLLK